MLHIEGNVRIRGSLDERELLSYLDGIKHIFNRKLDKIVEQGDRIMSKISEYVGRVDVNFTEIMKGIVELNDLIIELQNSPGKVTPEDQELLDTLETKSALLAKAAHELTSVPPPPAA